VNFLNKKKRKKKFSFQKLFSSLIFQINPQLLNYLNIEEGKQMNSIDWAGLYIYTCSKSCTAANKSYVEEFIYKQDFVN
jgi:hypothetical protein